MKHIVFLSCLLAPLLCFPFLLDGKKKSLIGSKAPAFCLKDETGKTIDSADIFKKYENTVIYFYPKDSSPHCTKEACSIRDTSEDFAKNNIFVIGISYDSPESHKNFKEKYKLPFMLLSDEDKKVAQVYGAASKSSLVPGFWPTSRVTFLISKGIIKQILTEITPSQHGAEILDAFKKA